MDLLILSSKTKEEFLKKLKKKCLEYVKKLNFILQFENNKNVSIDTRIPPLHKLKPSNARKMSIVIDGSTLNWVFEGDEYISQFFFRLGLFANSCICCRVSPKQKADV